MGAHFGLLFKFIESYEIVVKGYTNYTLYRAVQKMKKS